jgi:hypothetical protein
MKTIIVILFYSSIKSKILYLPFLAQKTGFLAEKYGYH